MRDDLRYEIRLLGSEMGVGDTRRVQCTQCHEHTMSLTRLSNGLLYHCFRASCGFSGFVPDPRFTELGPRLAVKQEGPRQYWGKTFSLTAADTSFFHGAFDLSAVLSEHNIQYTEHDEYYIRMRDVHGRTRGGVVRQPRWSTAVACPRAGRADRPKASIFWDTFMKPPMLSWYRSDGRAPYRGGRVVLVEDQISALKAAHFCLGVSYVVANLGTELDGDKVREISTVKPAEVIIAFDADATEKAFKVAQKWGLAFPKCRVQVLDSDLKDALPDTLTERFTDA